ncbi:hypothetical protein EIN_497920 [Entamoeba invadens IP1]|uniref:B30.2/SPRY domain-containing protein n=1 Tax=Entamoeba invadens IP1 TaxID=370355 RepID=A0A0A1UDH2_ENTIV|nr:hypothetical protein EIN_497920 [Entamoeba invadens IP1]ELP94612.1 hypothetical protein EIN_497920 [Entamoeba invadens IP1]|eukprot:XP_004261383.1 hypothetical protein EIN_497920 [Entamoeba invadens IP1]
MSERFKLFSLPEPILEAIFLNLTNQDFNNLLLAYPNSINDRTLYLRLKKILGIEKVIVEKRLQNRGFKFLIPKMIYLEAPQTIIPNTTDNKSLVRNALWFSPLTMNEMENYTHVARHPFGPGPNYGAFVNYEGETIIISRNVFYFEVTFDKIEPSVQYVFGIGLAPQSYPKNRMVGWDKDALGYHSDDGNLFYNSGSGKNYHTGYGEGDTVGCGFDVKRKEVFFTLNGKVLPSIKVTQESFFPAVSMKKTKSFKVNFGAEPFVYDAYLLKDQEMRNEEEKLNIKDPKTTLSFFDPNEERTLLDFTDSGSPLFFDSGSGSGSGMTDTDDNNGGNFSPNEENDESYDISDMGSDLF